MSNFFGPSNHDIQKQKIKANIERIVRSIIYNFKDPHINFFSINHIEINNDFSIVKVFISFSEDEKTSLKFLEIFRKKSGFFRTQLASKIKLYRAPNIIFIFDDRFVMSQKIDEILGNKN